MAREDIHTVNDVLPGHAGELEIRASQDYVRVTDTRKHILQKFSTHTPSMLAE